MDYKDALLWCEQFEENILLVDPERDKMVLALQAMRKCREALTLADSGKDEIKLLKEQCEKYYKLKAEFEAVKHYYDECLNVL